MMRYLVAPLLLAWLAAGQQPPAPPQKKGAQPPPVHPTVEETRNMQAKVDAIEGSLAKFRAKGVSAALLADVEVYANAGRLLLEFPDDFFTQDGINHTLAVLDLGIARAKQMETGQAPWLTTTGRHVQGFVSELDGSVQPYGVSIPASYTGERPVRLYVWMHGRQARTSEAEFIFAYPNGGPGRPPVADAGQITLDVYGRWNGAGWHFAGETDLFEAIDAVRRRYNVDPGRILLRGFSMGGEGAWHIALHHPDIFAAAEIGAGTWSRRPGTPGLPPYQEAALHIWENYTDWALNAFNLPIAGHDGDRDTQVSSLPPPPAGTPSRGQLESSIKVREQLAKEGFPSEGDTYDMVAKGTPSIFLISKDTGHGTSPEVRAKLDAFLKLHGDRGLVSPDHLRFLTYTTRYNRDWWATLDALEKHYERAEIDAERTEHGKHYRIATKNLTRLTLRETETAADIRIDGKMLRVKGAPSITLEKLAGGWQIAKAAALHKTHALQGPIDDAFLDPFVLVKPTGTPWNGAVQDQALRSLARFDRLYARFLRAHPRTMNDKDVTDTDIAKYNLVLFGDPGSNPWIAKVLAKLPVQWTRDAVTLGGQKYSAADHYPAMIFPNPLNPAKYVVINSGLTIEDREYRGDYGMPRLGDFAVLKVKDGSDVADVEVAGLFDESWQLPKEIR